MTTAGALLVAEALRACTELKVVDLRCEFCVQSVRVAQRQWLYSDVPSGICTVMTVQLQNADDKCGTVTIWVLHVELRQQHRRRRSHKGLRGGEDAGRAATDVGSEV